MRILGVSASWPKLKQKRWTTFRLRRRDKDWHEGEVVQIVYRPRSKQREVLGIAKIVSKELRHFWGMLKEGEPIANYEAVEDGFGDVRAMWLWMKKAHRDRIYTEPVNKLTLEWVK